MSDATDEATSLAAPQPLDEIIGYIGAATLYRFAKKQEQIDTLVLHMVYTRKKTALSQYVHELIYKRRKNIGERKTPKNYRGNRVACHAGLTRIHQHTSALSCACVSDNHVDVWK